MDHFRKDNCEMKDGSLKTLFFLAAAAAFLLPPSCRKGGPLEGDGPLPGEEIELTFSVGEAADDFVVTRSAPEEPREESLTFMGMEVRTSVTEECAAQTRGTVYNTVNLNGKRVYAYVFDPSTNKTVAAVQNLTISNNQLTVKGCRGCRILFYIGNAPSALVGTDITTLTTQENSISDAMQCVSKTIEDIHSDLGTLSFKHVFTKIRVTMKTSDGTPVNAFNLSLAFGYYRAQVDIASREYSISVPPPPSSSSSPGDTLTKHTFQVSGNTTSLAVTDYQHFIAPAAARSLKLVFATGGRGATIGGAKNHLQENVNNILTMQPHVFLPGHRYSIDITVRPSDSDVWLNSGFRSDRNWYQWDAYEPLGVGDSHLWSPGNSGIHPLPGGVSGQDLATQSCKDCPSLTEAKMYVGAGVLIDDGHTGPCQPSYTMTDPVSGAKSTYHTGVWLKKKQYIPGFSEGTAPQATTASGKGRPAPETVDRYFFLPLYGFRDMTSGMQNSFKGWGSVGFYHLRTANNNSYSYLLRLNPAQVYIGS